MRWILIGIIFLSSFSTGFGQSRFMDSVRLSLQEKPRFVLALHNRYALISGEPLRTNGIQAGMDFGGKTRIMFGVNWMPKPYTEKDISNRIPSDTLITTRRLSFFSMTGSYSVYHNRKLRFDFPLLLGIGIDDRTSSLAMGNTTERSTHFIMPVEIGATAVYSFNDWFGVKAGLGNRFTFGKSFGSNSGPYYSLGLAVFAQPFVDWAKNLFE